MAKPISKPKTSRVNVAKPGPFGKVVDEPIPQAVLDGDDPDDNAPTPASVVSVLGFDPNDPSDADTDNPNIYRDNVADDVPVPARRLKAPRKKPICRKPTARKARK